MSAISPEHGEFNERIWDHQERVASTMRDISNDIEDRGDSHDSSKFSEEEYLGFVELFGADFSMDVRSKEYQDIVTNAKTSCIQAHYKNNRHHPEHHANVADMTLLDLIEMVCDWKGASKSLRHKGGFRDNLAYLKQRKGLTEGQCFVVDLIVAWIDPEGEHETSTA